LSRSTLFRSFLQAGFECSTHIRKDGTRLDLLRSTAHDQFAKSDLALLDRFGIRTIRTAARWHLIESVPAQFDFSSLRDLFEASESAGIEVLLDLFHFGWPDYLDIFSDEFIRAFARFTAAATRFIKNGGYPCRFIAPVNEISFLSWAGGDKAAMNPYTINRGHELKRVLVRAAVVSSEILLNELPNVRLISPEPVIHIVGNPDLPGDDLEAERYRRAQFQAWDMVSGRMSPELGGRPEYLDILGANFYERNEWVHNTRKPLARTDSRYRPLHQILKEVWERYHRPMFVSETGTEDGARADWFRLIWDEVQAARGIGLPVEGLCLYPILNHPGWDDDRHCHNGLFDYADTEGTRNIHWPLAHAIEERLNGCAETQEPINERKQIRFDLPFSSSLGLRVSEAATSDEPICQ
jgi:hypothetical protein